MSRKMLRNVEKTRSSSRQNAPDSLGHSTASRFTDHCTFCRHSLLLPLPPAGNWVRFSCSIPRLFVLSRNMSMINTTGKLASFGRFFIPFSLLSAHLARITGRKSFWHLRYLCQFTCPKARNLFVASPLHSRVSGSCAESGLQLLPCGFTGHYAIAPRPTPGPAGSGRARTHPTGYSQTPTAEFPMNSPARSEGRGSLVRCWSGRRWHNFPHPPVVIGNSLRPRFLQRVARHGI